MSDTLFELIDGLPARSRLEAWWDAPTSTLSAHGLPASALPVFASWLAARAARPVLAIVPDPEAVFREAGAWFKDDVRTAVFPAVETLPFDRLAPDEETVRRRLEAIDQLGAGGSMRAASPACGAESSPASRLAARGRCAPNSSATSWSRCANSTSKSRA